MAPKPESHRERLQALTDEELEIFHEKAVAQRESRFAYLAHQEIRRRAVAAWVKEQRRRRDESRCCREKLETLTSYDFVQAPLKHAVLDALLPCHSCGKFEVLAGPKGEPLAPPKGLHLPTAEDVQAALAPLVAQGIYPTRYRVRPGEPLHLTLEMVEEQIRFLLQLASAKPMTKRELSKTGPNPMDTPGWDRFHELLDEAETQGEDLWPAIKRLSNDAPPCPGCGAPLVALRFAGDKLGWPPGTRQCPNSPRCRKRKSRLNRG